MIEEDEYEVVYFSPDFSSPSANDFREDAERRAKRIEMNKSIEIERQSRAKIVVQRHLEHQQKRRRETMSMDAADATKNRTPLEAKLAEIDYKLNGARARVNSGEFIPPRWIPDEEVVECGVCKVPFDWIRRKHHCRHCGIVVCGDCSKYRVMLPIEFGQNDPQRVCSSCHRSLAPLQTNLTMTVANHQRVNMVDTTKCLRRHFNMPYSRTLASEIRKAVYSVCNLFESDNLIKDRGIPLSFLPTAKGIAFLTVVKGGFWFGARFGTGLVLSRLPSGEWSAPSAIGTIGVSWGALIGADVTDYVIFLNTVEAVRAFAGVGQICIGAGFEVAIGPVGRSGEADMNIGGYGYAPAISYAHSRGLYAGVSLEGSVILSRTEVNHRFYGQQFTPLEILGGQVLPPRAAQPLYDSLNAALALQPKHQEYIRSAPQQRQSMSAMDGSTIEPTKSTSGP